MLQALGVLGEAESLAEQACLDVQTLNILHEVGTSFFVSLFLSSFFPFFFFFHAFYNICSVGFVSSLSILTVVAQQCISTTLKAVENDCREKAAWLHSHEQVTYRLA